VILGVVAFYNLVADTDLHDRTGKRHRSVALGVMRIFVYLRGLKAGVHAPIPPLQLLCL
jgi:hypothetical protein